MKSVIIQPRGHGRQYEAIRLPRGEGRARNDGKERRRSKGSARHQALQGDAVRRSCPSSCRMAKLFGRPRGGNTATSAKEKKGKKRTEALTDCEEKIPHPNIGGGQKGIINDLNL